MKNVWMRENVHGQTKKSYTLIIFLSLVMNSYYLYEWHQRFDMTLFPEHASQVGYNFYRYGTITRLYEHAAYHDYGVFGSGKLYDRAPSIKDTIGYGFLLGLLWKVTGTTSFYGIIFLQIVLFTLSICLIFQALCWFYKDQKKALYAVLGVLAFLPAAFLNVHPVKDMWSFYGTTVFLWVFLGLITDNLRNNILVSAAIFFGLCQWMRPTIFGVLLAFLCVGLPVFYYWFRLHFPILKKMLGYFFIINMAIFWLPWVTYNKITYNRFFVGPTGLALLTSLGDFPNKWGIEPTESWIGQHVQEKYPQLGYENETQEFDDAAKSIFLEYVKEQPFLYVKNLFRRIFKLLFINPPWTDHCKDFWAYSIYSSKLEAFLHACNRGILEIIKCCAFYFYVRFFLFLSYLGCFMAFRKSSYRLPALLVSLCIVGNSGEILSHVEGKYIMQSYGFLGVFVGLFVFYVKEYIYSSRFYRGLAVKKMVCQTN